MANIPTYERWTAAQDAILVAAMASTPPPSYSQLLHAIASARPLCSLRTLKWRLAELRRAGRITAAVTRGPRPRPKPIAAPIAPAALSDLPRNSARVRAIAAADDRQQRIAAHRARRAAHLQLVDRVIRRTFGAAP